MSSLSGLFLSVLWAVGWLLTGALTGGDDANAKFESQGARVVTNRAEVCRIVARSRTYPDARTDYLNVLPSLADRLPSSSSGKRQHTADPELQRLVQGYCEP